MEVCLEGSNVVESRDVDRGADCGFVIGDPDGAVAVRHLALDHGRAQCPFGGVVGCFVASTFPAKAQNVVAERRRRLLLDHHPSKNPPRRLQVRAPT